MEDQGDPAEKDHSLSVVLPSGLEKTVTVHGSKPVIDLLVTLCARYHLNPSDHTVEVLSHNKNHVGFKPNSLIGSLGAETIVLKPKVAEDKARRPYTPEATVRLLINYRKSHKTVVRVNPRVPLEDLVSAISEKCEFQPESTALLRDSLTQEPLDLTNSLNDLGIRELFAKDTSVVDVFDTGPVEGQPPSRNEKKRRGNNGFLRLFRRKKDKDRRVYMPVSQDLKEPIAVSASTLGLCSAETSTACTPKKRPAPRPPMMASQSVPDNISGHRVREPQSSAEATLRRTKRKAPPPPCANSHAHLPAVTEGSAGMSNSIREWELRTQRDSVNTSRTGSPLPSSSSSSSSSTISSSNQLLPQPQEDGRDSCTPESQRAHKELSHVHSVLAQILNSSLSNGKLRTRSGNAPFSKSYNDGDKDNKDDSITHEPLLPPKCLFGGRGGSDLHPELWEDSLQRKGLTTFKVVPSKKHRYHKLDQGLAVPDDQKSSPRRDSEVRESRPDSDPPRSPEPRTSSPADPEEVHGEGELGVSQAEPASPSLRDSGSQTQSAEVDRPSPDPESRTVREGEVEGAQDEEVSDVEDKEVVHEEEEVVKDKGVQVEEVQREELQEEGDYDEVPEEDDDYFPPPPPPVSYDDQEEAPDEAAGERSTLLQSSSVLPPPPPPSSSSSQIPDVPGTPTKEPRPRLGASSPLKRVSMAPSRFAQAVALAVQKTRSSQSQGMGYGNLFKSRSRPDAVPAWLPQSSVNSGSCPG
ncbi:unnamed protein product [Lota lota]